MTLGDIDVFATLPLATYQPGEIILAEGSKTGRLWILKKGAVVVARQGIEIAKVTEPGAVFGDISALLDTPHTADVRALETSVFHVVDAATSLQDPAVLVHVARILAQRLNVANQTLVDLKTKHP
jgi:CRP-like cAMP-binding protein